jgi:hypothetical protein
MPVEEGAELLVDVGVELLLAGCQRAPLLVGSRSDLLWDEAGVGVGHVG